MKLIDIIAGARPNFMKIAPIIRELDKAISLGADFSYRLIHTGQHYDQTMSGSFFEQLGIPVPEINLEVGSGSQAEQTAAIMVRYEKLIKEKRADLCIVVGDVNSTMACAIAAKKECIPVAHVEAGIRSGDWTMPEEINRIVTDSIADYFFTTSVSASENLMKNGVESGRISFVGNTMIDTLLYHLPALRKPSFWEKHHLKAKSYLLLTLHRPTNVDSTANLVDCLDQIGKASKGVIIIFPAHPRTIKTMANLRGIPTNILIVEPQPYLEFIYLVKNALAVITDSGGITEEATVLDVPCLTLRNSTERPETITDGTNELIGTNYQNIIPELAKVFFGQWKKGRIPERWDGKAAARIVDFLANEIFS